jgi:type VII secretion-associated protein (TIGR03931 family)
VSGHPTIIEAGPSTIRRLCCGTSMAADGDTSELISAALGAIDDRVALVGERPVAVDSLWGAALRSVNCGSLEAQTAMVVVHPSWWSSSRVGVVTSAAESVADDVLARPRSSLLVQASEPGAAVAVEIAERLVVITGAEVAEVAEVVAIPRRTEPHRTAEEVAAAIAEMTRDVGAVVLIDAPSTVVEAPALARLIADAVRGSGRTVAHLDDARLARLARAAQQVRSAPSAGGVRSHARTLRGLAAAVVVLVAAVPLVTTGGRHRVSAVQTAPTTFLVEGHVALTVPANWPTQRIIAGPGSARVQVTSPSDPEVALHITQSPVPGETLRDAAERIKRAIDAERAGVFVDFNPSAMSADRAAVTYREVRPGHQVRWTVLLDGAVRISVGCQSRPGDEDAVRAVCEQAVRSAHAIG